MSKVVTELDIELAKWQAKIAQIKADMASTRQAAKSSSGIGNDFADKLANVLPAITAAGTAYAVKGTLEHFDALADAATKLGETPEVMQRVARAAELSATTTDGLASAMLKLEKNLGDVENAKPAQILESYGLSAEKLMSMPLDEKIAALADAFKQARDSGTGVYELQQLLGKGGSELIPLLEEGGDSIRQMFENTHVVANAAVYEMSALNDEVDNVILNLKSLGGEALVGAMDTVRWYVAEMKDFWANITGNPEAANNELQRRQAKLQRREDAEAKVNEVNQRREQRAIALQEGQDAAAAERAQKQADAEAEKQAREEDARQKRITKMAEEFERLSIDVLPPDEKIAALRAKLESIQIGGDDSEEQRIEKQLTRARLAREIDQVLTSGQEKTGTATFAPPGSAVTLMGLLTGANSAELIATQQVNKLGDIHTTLQAILAEVTPAQSPFHSDTNNDTFR